jgi:hypothetical protein
MGPEPVPASDTAVDLTADLARLRELIAEAPITEARTFVKGLEQRWPESAEVQHFARVLAPPVVRTVSGAKYRARDLSPEFDWLRKHADTYPGCWLALQGGRLLGANRELKALLAEIHGLPESESAFLHFQPPSKEPS